MVFQSVVTSQEFELKIRMVFSRKRSVLNMNLSMAGVGMHQICKVQQSEKPQEDTRPEKRIYNGLKLYPPHQSSIKPKNIEHPTASLIFMNVKGELSIWPQ